MKRIGSGIIIAFVASAWAAQVQAVVVDFTGGTVTRLDTTTAVTNNTVDYNDVDYYEENGFRLNFLPNSGSSGFATHVGDYYPLAFNDVIHSHWSTGDFGGVMSIEITKIAGGTFNLNYFILTSNTDSGGGAASGLEQAYVQGFLANVPTGPAVLLPSENWGFPATQIFLNNTFDGVDKVVVNVTNRVDCFGMDEFYLDQEYVPEPGSLTICGLMAALGFASVRCRRKN